MFIHHFKQHASYQLGHDELAHLYKNLGRPQMKDHLHLSPLPAQDLKEYKPWASQNNKQ